MHHTNENYKSHFMFKHTDKLREINKPLFNESSVYLVWYAQIFRDGSYANLTTHASWSENCFEKGYNSSNLMNSRIVTGVNYWKRLSNKNLSLAAIDARENFDIDARIEFTDYNKAQDCFFIYSFGASRKNADKAYSFYGNHLSKLMRFITYFRQEAQDLILQAAEKKNRLITPDFIQPSIQNSCVSRDFPMEIAREHMEFSPSDKEWIVMLLYAHGLQKEVVARMLNKSLPTIVTQIESIKNKTGLMNRFEMMMYLKDKEEDKNINFFVPYIPENAA